MNIYTSLCMMILLVLVAILTSTQAGNHNRIPSHGNMEQVKTVADQSLEDSKVGDETAARDRRSGYDHQGVPLDVHTFAKTNEHAHFHWGVKHQVGHQLTGIN
ncbi:hypothetical protein O3M35_011797 [Rhynocoris fuscipes]|uniref:Secreted protein n=1 Tax=Rhynocoris fuscipes TaxID=488301 RepID=A0AAW1D2U0_9HEMI